MVGVGRGLIPAFRLLLPILADDVSDEGRQPGKLEAGINVVLDDVEGEGVGPAKAPDTNGEQGYGPGIRPVGNQDRCGQNTNRKHQAAFGV